MTRYARGLMAGSLLALGIWLLAASTSHSAADDDKEVKDAENAITKIADAKGGAADKMAADTAKKYTLDIVMTAFKPRAKKGIGVGPNAGKITPDGIELKIISLGKRTLSKAQLTKEADALARMTDITKAIGEVTKHTPAPKKAGKGPADWKKYTDEMIKGSEDLKKAIQSGNPANVKKAATDLNASCTNCHSDFRD